MKKADKRYAVKWIEIKTNVGEVTTFIDSVTPLDAILKVKERHAVEQKDGFRSDWKKSHYTCKYIGKVKKKGPK